MEVDDPSGEDDIVDDFLYAGSSRCCVFLTVARSGDESWLTELLGAHPELVTSTDSNGNTALHFSSANGHDGTRAAPTLDHYVKFRLISRDR